MAGGSAGGPRLGRNHLFRWAAHGWNAQGVTALLARDVLHRAPTDHAQAAQRSGGEESERFPGLGGDVAGNLSRPVAGDAADRAGGSDRDQRVRRRPVAQNSPAAVADDLVSGIVEKSDAVRLQVNPVSAI